MRVSLLSLRAPSSVTDPSSGQTGLALCLPLQPLVCPLDTKWGCLIWTLQLGEKAGLKIEMPEFGG